MKVERVMSRNVRACSPEESLSAAARIMWERDCGCVPVMETLHDGPSRVVGIVTDRDVCMAAYTQGRPLAEIPVKGLLPEHVVTCQPSDSVEVALGMMRAHQLHRLPVVDADGRLLGILSLADVAREAAREKSQWKKAVSTTDVGRTVEAISEPRGERALAAAAG